jgi:hypothetical protein
MDFNTASSGGTRGSGGPPPDSGGSSRERSSAAAAEFTYTDPVQSFVDTVRSVVLTPVDFFRGIRRQGDIANPLIFALICAVVSGVLSGIIAFVGALVSDAGVGEAFSGLLGGVFLSPIATAIGLFIGAAIYYLLVMFLVKPNSGFEATFRVLAYASVVQLVSWLTAVPILGILIALLAGLYSLFLLVVGIREVHATTTGKAALVVLIPLVVLGILALIFGVVVALLVRAALS